MLRRVAILRCSATAMGGVASSSGGTTSAVGGGGVGGGFLRYPTSTVAPRLFFDVVSEVPSTEAPGHHIHAASTIDAIPETPRLVSIYMLASYDRQGVLPASAALIDNNTSAAVPHVVRALEAGKIAPSSVKYIIVTHAHLDHCAATGTLLKLFPEATVLCHPKAKKHLVNPTQLIASAKKVYTPEEFQQQVGDMIPCDAERVRAVADGETVSMAVGRDLTFRYTEGHASHHMVVHDPATASVFAGDSFGVSFNDLWQHGLQTDTVIPTSSPVDFDAVKAVAAVELIRDLPRVRRVWPTHFGPTDKVADCAAQLLDLLPKYEALRQELIWELKQPKPKTRVDIVKLSEERMTRIVKDHFYGRGLATEPSDLWRTRLHLDISVNALGLVVAAERRPF